MSMTNLDKMEKIQRLRTAYMKLKDLREKESISTDFHIGTEIAQQWPLITASYSGLEQTLKYLIADEKSLTINELIHRRTLSGNSRCGSNQRYPYRTHDLKWLFCQLKDSTKCDLRKYYTQFQSLHSYIEIEDIETFLAEISGSNGQGYEIWRYTLIEDEKELPRTSVEAMISIWGVCIAIAASRNYENETVWMLAKELNRHFWQRFQEYIIEVSIRRQDVGEDFQNLNLEAHTLFAQYKHPLNCFAQVLRHFNFYESHGLTGASDQLSEVLNLWAKSTLEISKKSGISSHWWFVERALGNTLSGEGIKFNIETQRFEEVPWSLASQCKDTLPEEAIEVKHPTSVGSLDRLRIAARESDAEVRENRAFVGETTSGSERWHCVMEVSDMANKKVVTIWQKRGMLSQEFHFIEECPRKSMRLPIKNWIKINRMFQNQEFEESNQVE